MLYFEKKFLSWSSIERAIERSVIAMVRLFAPDYLGQKDKSKLAERKEFIYYQEMWEGNDCRGVPLNPVRNTLKEIDETTHKATL